MTPPLNCHQVGAITIAVWSLCIAVPQRLSCEPELHKQVQTQSLHFHATCWFLKELAAASSWKIDNDKVTHAKKQAPYNRELTPDLRKA